MKLETYEGCLEAVKEDGRLLYRVPEEHQTYELCLEAVKKYGGASSRLKCNLVTESKDKLFA